jgi:threonine aldolase
MAGGTVTPLLVLEEIWAGAREAGLPVHLDGARVFNAAVALGLSVKELTRGFDTVMFCLSKGLGAPVGSMLVGSAETIARARVYRKALGGGMRQAGVIAAAGLIALKEMPQRLHEDHAKARSLAEAVAQCEGAEIDLAAVQTNIVIFSLRGTIGKGGEGSGGDAPRLVAELKAKGVLASAIGPHQVRLVTHCDVSREDCEVCGTMLREMLGRSG